MPTNEQQRILLTGASGVGKSTLLARLAQNLPARTIRGFLSASVWDGEHRLGWRLDAAGGSDGGLVLHRDIESPRHMGPYGVDMQLLERIALTQLIPLDPAALYLIDEIGRVSQWSDAVTAALRTLLASPAPLVAIVREADDGASPLAQEAMRRTDVRVITVTTQNHDALVEELTTLLSH